MLTSHCLLTTTGEIQKTTMAFIRDNQETTLIGMAISPGIAMAPMHVIARGSVSCPELYPIEEKDIAQEQARFQKAVEATKLQISKLNEHISEISGDNEELIFEAHHLLLEDPAFLKKVNTFIAERLQNAEYATFAVSQTLCESIRRTNDEYLAERASDIDDICQRLLRNFSPDDHATSISELDHQHVVLAYDITPSDTASMDRSKILGFVTEQGSANSHTAIIARSLGIPAVVGIDATILDVKSLTFIILDGYTGKVIFNPKEATLKQYRALQKHKQKQSEELSSLRNTPTETLCGKAITLAANMELAEEISYVNDSGAQGVGLFRTEFYLLHGGDIPNEQIQADTYEKVITAVSPHQTIIRTLDAGGDKLPAEPLTEQEPNPFLGWRGIRVSLSRPSMFKEQLRAILRASAHGRTGIMFPMISGCREIFQAKEILYQCMNELSNENVPFDRNIEIGVMIEIPSAALMAQEIAKHVDFFSIGTNDLVQYTVAVDRINKNVSHLYRPTHPAVIRLIKQTTQAAHDHGIWTGVCGEMASELRFTPLLLGLGVDELSVSSHMLPKIKKAIRSLHMDDCQRIADQALQLSLSQEIFDLTASFSRETYGELID